MITITETPRKVTIKGHASDMKHPRSEDTIQACASITALCQTLLGGIDYYGDKPTYEIGIGHFELDKDGLSDESKSLIDIFIIGCRLVQTAYPENIIVQA